MGLGSGLGLGMGSGLGSGLGLGRGHLDDRRLAARRGRTLVLAALGGGFLLVVALEPRSGGSAVDLLAVLEHVDRLVVGKRGVGK